MKIYPSILQKDVTGLFAQLNKLLPVFDYAQIDIADGIFVETKTLQIEEITAGFDANPTIINVPLDKKSFEFHLMVENYEPELLKIEALRKYLNITTVLIHASPFARHNFIVPNTNFKIGLTLNPEDTVADHIKSLHLFDVAQIMTVVPGKQGQPFLPEVLVKIEQLRQSEFDGTIILDGAMNDQTLAVVLQQKDLPDAICPGSYLGMNEPQQALNKLEALIAEKFL